MFVYCTVTSHRFKSPPYGTLLFSRSFDGCGVPWRSIYRTNREAVVASVHRERDGVRDRERERERERGAALDTAGDDGTAAYCSVRLSCQLSGLVCTLNRLVRALLQLPTDHVDNHLLISSPV